MSEAPGRRAIAEIDPSHQELRVLSYPSSMSVSSRALNLLADALRRRRRERATRWRKLSAGRQALLVVAHLRKGETYAELACLPDRDLDGLPLPARGDRAARRTGSDPGPGDRGRRGQGVRDPRQHPA